MKAAIPLIALAAAFALAWFFTPLPQGDTPRSEEVTPGKLAHSSHSSHSSSPQRRANILAQKSTYQDKARHVIALASSIPIPEIKDWHTNSYLDALDGDLEHLFSSITSERWLEDNPREFLTWSQTMNYERHDFFLAKWAETDPNAALSFLKTSSPGNFPSQFSSLLRTLTQTNPEIAFDLAAKHLPSMPASHYRNNTLASLANLDPERALALRDTLPASLHFKTTIAIAGTLLKSDFSRSLQLLQEEKAGWEGLLQALDSGPYYESRTALIENSSSLPAGWLEKIIERSPHNLILNNSLALFDASPAELGVSETAYQKLLNNAQNTNFSKEVRPQLMNLINGTKLPLETRRAFLAKQIQNWETDNPHGLRNWLSQIDDPSLHETADINLSAYNEQSVANATPNSNTPASLVKTLSYGINEPSTTSGWDATQVSQGIEAYQNLTPQEQAATFAALSRNARGQQGNRQFEAAVYQHQASLPLPENSSERNQIIQNITIFSATWASKEPAKAASWAAQLPPGPSREWSLRNVARTWHSYSKSEVHSWFGTLPASDQITVAIFLPPTSHN